MSLILTTISRRGIVHASDSNLSSATGPAGTGQKVFEVPALCAALSVAGAYSVSNVSMAAWVPATINQFMSQSDPRLGALAEFLRKSLEQQMTPAEKACGSLMHLCGYVPSAGATLPEFYFVRNISGIDPSTGTYLGVSDQFACSEDFRTRDCLTSETKAAIAAGGQQLYINGFPAGRIGYLALMGRLGQFFRDLWNEPAWKFRPPTTLAEEALLVDLQLRAIGSCFVLSDYDAPYIGGEPQVQTLARPLNCQEFWAG